MVNVSARLLAQLAGDAADLRPTLLELGCGTGAMTVALLKAGATSADGVDLSPESLATARRRADEAGVSERVRFENGDAAVLDLTAHDWVVLDRVFCCYPDVEALLANASGAAARRLAFSVPTSRGLRGLANRIFWGVEAFLTRFQRGPCPGYVHSVDRIEAALSAAGFRRVSHASAWFWYTAVWERS
jgi:ubiquinone/menaquinone biosynthesis C-methylase UbiE